MPAFMYVVICSYLYNRFMVRISQGTLKEIRDDMFNHMQQMPIRYFDTHTHGDIMSHYTNDTDTLRQFISQSLPQLISSVITIVVILISMIVSSIPLTLLVLLFTAIMIFVTQKAGGASARYFIRQQESIGNVTGYIEEMINGQKVIKVFCHEETAKKQFAKKNDDLCGNTIRANRYGNILMPVIMQLGNLQYVLLAFIGGLMALGGHGGITVGLIVAFLNLSKTFCMPISQISQQISMMAMALAGAERIFELIDEAVEEDQGYVTLVRAAYDKNYELKSAAAMTESGHGNILMEMEQSAIRLWREISGSRMWILGTAERKTVLHHINIDAKSGQKIAFVGATGAGKTTITNLINRFYDITNGNICYDGIDIDKIRKPDLRRSLGVVLQDVNLLQERLWKISVMEIWKLQMKNVLQRQSLPMPMILLWDFRRAIRRY